MPESIRPTIVMISPALSHPRFHKRATQLFSHCRVEAFSFQRQYYEINTFPDGIPCISLGRVENGKYWLRGFRLLRAAMMIRRNVRNLPVCYFYAMGLDCLVLAKLSGIKHGFYEVGDLRQAQGQGRLMALPERHLLKGVSGLVLTSRFFYEDFYRHTSKSISADKVYVIDNKIDPSLGNQRPILKRFCADRISIGLIGLFRYQKPIELLLQFVRSHPDRYTLNCFGDGPLRNLIISHIGENIRYHGTFKNPEALPTIYQKIDLNFVVYDSSSTNVRLAMPNKIFESAFFGVPIICCAGTAVAKLAAEWGIGTSVRIDNPQNFYKDMNQIDSAWLESHSKRCFSIPKNQLIDDGQEVVRKILNRIPEFE